MKPTRLSVAVMLLLATLTFPSPLAAADPPDTVEVVIRGFVPSEAWDGGAEMSPYEGDNRDFGYANQGSSRVEVRLTLDVATGTIVGSPEVRRGHRIRYSSSDPVPGKPAWWRSLNQDSGNPFVNLGSGAESFRQLNLSEGWRGVEARFGADMVYGFDEHSVAWGTIDVGLRTLGDGSVWVRVEGAHSEFPSWEIYVNGNEIHRADARITMFGQRVKFTEEIVVTPGEINDVGPRDGDPDRGGSGDGHGSSGGHGSTGSNGGSGGSGGYQIPFDCYGTVSMIDATLEAISQAEADCEKPDDIT